MIFAQLKDGVVVNTIIITDVSMLPFFQADPMTGDPYDILLQVDATYPQPGIGWTFDGITFSPPDTSE